MLTGVNDQNVQELKSLFGIRVVMRGDELILSGSQSAVKQATPVVQHIIELSKLREPFDVTDIARFADGVTIGGEDGIGSVEDMIRIALPGSRRVISPKSSGQRIYIEAITRNDIVIGIGLSWLVQLWKQERTLDSSRVTYRRRSIRISGHYMMLLKI